MLHEYAKNCKSRRVSKRNLSEKLDSGGDPPPLILPGRSLPGAARQHGSVTFAIPAGFAAQNPGTPIRPSNSQDKYETQRRFRQYTYLGMQPRHGVTLHRFGGSSGATSAAKSARISVHASAGELQSPATAGYLLAFPALLIAAWFLYFAGDGLL